MPEVSPAAHALAQRVLVHDVGGHVEAVALAEATARADARLRGRLAALIGATGYTTLVSRAVRLAQAEVPALEGVAVDAGTGMEGSLRGVRAFAEAARASGADARAVEAGLTAILAHVIGLLSTFIGEDLALRLVREAWPEITPTPAASEGHA